MKYRSHKTYGHDIGLSCCFRQWRAQSHCNKLHGYALSVHLEFEASTLDACNWVVDFGSLKPVKKWLEDTFDHKLLIARDDPLINTLGHLASFGLADVVVVDATGCEAFAFMISRFVHDWLYAQPLGGRVSLLECRVKEHGANGASVVFD